MAGWTSSSAAASGTGGGGWRFTSRGGNNRWRERGRERPAPQPHYRYRPVDSNAHRSSPPPPHRHSRPAMDQGASTSTRRSQPPRIPPTDDDDDKSPMIPAASAVMPPADASDDKASRNAANFECNVCFEMAADPVVTKCGHLFCWECLYQWLHVHSHHRECPVCKGQVADDAIIPIYGRGGSAADLHTAPPRPTGARVESYRQQLLGAVPDLPMDDDQDPFDLHEFRLGFGVSSSLTDAMISFMPDHEVDMEQLYDDYTNVYHYDDDLLGGFPVFASAGGSSQGHGVGDDHLMEAFFHGDIDTDQPAFGHPGTNHQNRGRRHGRRQRARAAAAAAAASAEGMVMGASGAFYRHTGAGPNVTTGGGGSSSRPYGGWTERRGGRSNRNSSSATGRGVQDSRRHRTNCN